MSINDQVIITGRSGPANVPEGGSDVIRLTRCGGVLTQGAGPYYYEPSRLGRIFTASNAVAGVAPGTALSTTPPICIWNPLGSGINLSILKASLGYVSGTLGAGSIVFAYNPGQTIAPTTGTELIPVNNLIGQARGTGRAFTGSTIGAAGLIIRPFCFLGAALATTVNFPASVTELVDGEFTVGPGMCFIMQGVTAAGSTPLVIFGISWQEIPQ